MSATTVVKKCLHLLLGFSLIVAPLHVGLASAAMIETESRIIEMQGNYDRDQLRELVSTDAVRDQLLQLGVSPEQVNERISVMTPAELAQFNSELEQMPAGAGIVGTVVLVFVILIVLDLLGTTDIFPVIKPLDH